MDLYKARLVFMLRLAITITIFAAIFLAVPILIVWVAVVTYPSCSYPGGGTLLCGL